MTREPVGRAYEEGAEEGGARRREPAATRIARSSSLELYQELKLQQVLKATEMLHTAIMNIGGCHRLHKDMRPHDCKCDNYCICKTIR